MTFRINGVKVSSDLPDFTPAEAARYVEYIQARVPDRVTEISVSAGPREPINKVEVSYVAQGEPFERIRRITGYLVGTIDRWNDAKKSEERERVKHEGGNDIGNLPRMRQDL